MPTYESGQTRLNSGLFQGMQVTVDFFALKVDHA
jgi:hypothetical protein